MGVDVGSLLTVTSLETATLAAAIAAACTVLDKSRLGLEVSLMEQNTFSHMTFSQTAGVR